jgi:hypothetical protein
MKKIYLFFVLCLLSIQAFCQPSQITCDTTGLSSCGFNLTIIPDCPGNGLSFTAVVFNNSPSSLPFTDFQFFADCEKGHGSTTTSAQAVSQSFHGLPAGTYEITFIGVRADGSRCFQTTTVTTPLVCASRSGASNLVDDQSLEMTLSPNPSNTTTSFVLNGVSGLAYTVNVRDIKGQTVDSFQNLNSGASLEIGANYEAGVYFIEVVSSNGVKRKKFVKI